jgi:hypothetical protein
MAAETKAQALELIAAIFIRAGQRVTLPTHSASPAPRDDNAQRREAA